MKGLLFYFLQVIICSGLLYGYYYIALRNKKFHLYNRYYLLSTMLISIIIPFLHIPVYFISDPDSTPAFIQALAGIYETEGVRTEGGTETVTAAAGFDWAGILKVVYLSVAAIVFIKLIVSLLRISGLLKKYEVKKIDQYYFVNTTEAGTPFSFIKWIFWNKEIDLHSSNGQQIFRHELYHLRHKHSLDIIFTEILTAVYWINPFFHLIRKEVKTIHEFLADQFAATENDKWTYAELLLMQVLRSPNRLINPFFHNQIKRRIAMITSSQQANFKYLRKLMVLPIAAIMIAVFAFKYKTKPVVPIDKTMTVVIDAGHGKKDNGNFSGAIADDGTYEDVLVLGIAKKIKKLNANDKIKIILTRDGDKIVEHEDRVKITKANKADLFISIHTNASVEKSKNKNGVEIYVPSKNNQFYSENRLFANIVMNYLSSYYSISTEPRQRTAETGIAVLDRNECPAILVECGYITNKDDLEFTKSELGQEEIAKSILKSIEQYALQSEMPDWNDRKSVFTDTTRKPLTIVKDPKGNPKAMYDGKAVTRIEEHESGQLILWVDEALVLLGKDESEKIKKKYGNNLQGLIIPRVEMGKTVPMPKDDPDVNNKIFEKVEIEAEFPGGVNAWRKFLQDNMKPSVPVEKGAPAGKYTIWLQFIVDNKDGNISDLKALTNHGYGMEEEALRVMRLSPDWLPAIQNGRKVKAYRKQPITFVISDQ